MPEITANNSKFEYLLFKTYVTVTCNSFVSDNGNWLWELTNVPLNKLTNNSAAKSCDAKPIPNVTDLQIANPKQMYIVHQSINI